MCDVCTYVMSVLFIFVYGGLIYAYAYRSASTHLWVNDVSEADMVVREDT